MTDRLEARISRSVVQELADARALLRGATYESDGKVEIERSSADRCVATVHGVLPYRVELWIDLDELTWTCTCPAGAGAVFCEHCVATALAVKPQVHGAELSPDGDSAAEGGADVEVLRDHVAGMARRQLVEIVLEQAAHDPRLLARLEIAAGTAGDHHPVDLDEWRRRLDAAFDGEGVLDESDELSVLSWVNNLHAAIAALEDLLAAGHADEVVELAEHAFRLDDEALRFVDDSDGWLSELAVRIRDLHLAACAESSVDPEDLAARLVDLELNAELDTFRRSAATYARVLGDEGLVAFRTLVEPRRAEVGPPEGYAVEGYGLQEAMTGWALAAGDVDTFVEVKRGVLDAPEDYREVAEALAVAGRSREALEWASQGIEAFPDRQWQLGALRELAAALRHQLGDQDEAVEVFWAGFAASPSMETYERLLREAELTDAADEWCQRALQLLRGRLEDPDEVGEWTVEHRLAASLLVEVLLANGDAEEAWDVATEQGCDDRLWLELARAREDAAPLEAISVYEREIAARIGRRNAGSYQTAVELLGRIHALAGRAGEPERFDRIVAHLRSEHSRKRNLMALLASNGW
ncbi:MAG: SWIM zinc finger family protein [Actinomycetota bacterium]|nr:SWIM zinc finger family protein [Actinomycetota bacterium]